MYPPLFSPTLQMGRKSGLHSFSPSVRWKSESVSPTLFSHCNKVEKKSVPPTLFFPIIEGEKVQRVRNYPYPHEDFILQSQTLHIGTHNLYTASTSVSSVRRANARISIFCHVVIKCLLSPESVNKVNPVERMRNEPVQINL